MTHEIWHEKQRCTSTIAVMNRRAAWNVQISRIKWKDEKSRAYVCLYTYLTFIIIAQEYHCCSLLLVVVVIIDSTRLDSTRACSLFLKGKKKGRASSGCNFAEWIILSSSTSLSSGWLRIALLKEVVVILEQQCSSAVCMYCSQSTWLLDRLERLEGREEEEEEDEAIGLISSRRCVLLLLLDQEGRMDVERANKTSLSLSPSLSPLASPVMDWCREIRKTRTTGGPRRQEVKKGSNWRQQQQQQEAPPPQSDWLTDFFFRHSNLIIHWN